ncbi:MAG: carboxypeptidase M32, partial [Pseudomonadota bacterium]
MTAYDDLMAFQRETEALSQIAGRLGWDQETMMPQGATPQRAEEHGAMANILHARRIDPKVGDWLETAEAADDVAAANLRHIKRDFERTAKVPAALAAELAKTTSLAHRVWAQA